MIDDVLEIMRNAADVAILPRFRRLRDSEIAEKFPDEIVTVADRETEILIAEALKVIRPDAFVVGEEAVATDPGLLDALPHHKAVWLLDPLDGTANFVAGSQDFAVMVALIESGRTTHAWIWRPAVSEAWTAKLGFGARRNDAPVWITDDDHRNVIRGAVLTRFFTPEHRSWLSHAGSTVGEILPGVRCAGVEYPDVISGTQDFAMFRRTLPWDHAPGALILREAGGIARRWNGSDYEPTLEGEGLLVSRDDSIWERVAATLLPPPARIGDRRV